MGDLGAQRFYGRGCCVGLMAAGWSWFCLGLLLLGMEG